MDTYRMIHKISISDSMDRFVIWFKKTFLHPGDAMLTFYLLFLVSLGCFGVTLVSNYCTVPLSGDYTLQEMTFLFNGYDDWHTFFRTGSFPTWDRSVFLGIDNIGGNSFYYLFDPFFLLCLPFPRDWLLPLQGLSFLLKTTLAGMLFYWYLGSFDFSNKTRRIGALCYGFSAYSFSYLWFHFIDSVAFLPLVFLGVERLLKKRDPRIFLVGFFLNAMTSYFFFVVFMFGAFFYAIFRYFQTMKERTPKENLSTIGVGFLSFVVAVMLGCFTLLPGMSTATQMPRVSSASYLSKIFSAETFKEKLDAIFGFSYSHNQVTPLLNFLFLYDDCYSSNLLNVYWYDNMVAGLYATTPMLLLFFVSFIQAIKKKRWSYIIGLILTAFLVFTPVGYYLFSGFTVGYARFYIVPIAWMVAFDCKSLEQRRDIPRTDLDLSFVITLLLMAVSCFLMIYEVNDSPSSFKNTEWDLKMVLIPGSILWVTLCYFVMRRFFHKKKFSKAVFFLSSVDIIVMANLTINCHGLSSASQNPTISEESKIVELLKKDEDYDDFYRIYNTSADRGNINLSMREGYQGLGAFHSVYAYQAQNFIDRSRIPYTSGNWSMGVHNRRYNLETFLGTKYYLVDRINQDYFDDADNMATPWNYQKNGWVRDYDIPYGYVDVTTLNKTDMEKLGIEYSDELLSYLKSDSCTKTLYVNTDFIDFAFAFDTIFDESWLGTSFDKDGAPTAYNRYEDYNEYPLLRYAILPDEDYQTFYKEGKYNAGTILINGQPVTIHQNLKPQQQSNTFSSALVNDSDGYVAPIKEYHIGSGTNRLKATIFSANWPATANNPSGEYAQWNKSDPYDTTGEESYKKKYPWEYQNGIRPADDVYDYVTRKDIYGNTYDRNVLYNSKILLQPVDRNGKPSPILPDADPSKPETGGYISLWNQKNIEWRLYDKDDHLISFAKHSYAEYKQAHGYYADRPVYKILGIVQSGSKDEPVNLSSNLYVCVQKNSDYQKAIDKLRENPVDITYRVDDMVSFTTDYTSDKFVVLNYPVSNGWNLYEVTDGKKEKVKTYTAQGGFISFEGKQGKHQYQLVYSSPYFKEGFMITALGLFITLIALAYYGQRNRIRKLAETSSMTYLKDMAVRKDKMNYDSYEDEL